MMDKLKQMPMGVIIAIAAAVLGLASFFIFRTVSAQNKSVTEPMDRTRYAQEMQKRSATGQYSAQGQPGSRNGVGAGMGAGMRSGYGGGGYGRPSGYGGQGGGYGGR